MAQLGLCSERGEEGAGLLLRLLPSLVPPKFRAWLPTHAQGRELPQVCVCSWLGRGVLGVTCVVP